MAHLSVLATESSAMGGVLQFLLRAKIARTGLCLLLWSAAMFANACMELVGEPRQGALLWGQVPQPWQAVYLDDEQLRISPEGIVVFGFGRDTTGVFDLRLYDGKNDWCTQPLTVQTREYKISRVEGVPQRTVTPDPKDAERIAAEREKVRRAKAIVTDRTDFANGFQWPVTGRVSGVYGSQRVYNGKPGSPHYGVDVAQPTGTPVAAPAAGVIVLAEPDLFYSGGTIIIDHGSQVSSSMLHLSEVLVEVGQRVEPGDIIGKIGATGRATGPHLDWRMSWRQQRVDPQLLVPPMP